MTDTPLLLLTADSAVERAVRTAHNGGELLAFKDSAALAARLGEGVGRVVLMDLEPDATAALGDLAVLALRFPDARFVVLCRELSADVLLAAMQAGARHGLRRDTLGAELHGVVQRLGSDGVSGQAVQVVTVLSASGGCGCTTVAIALAEELRRAGQVLLVDLDAHYGAAATYLGLKGPYGVADVLSRQGTIDADLVTSTARSYGEDFRVLLSPVAVNPSEPMPLDWKRLPELLTACRKAAPYVVVDASRVPPPAAAELVAKSSLTLLVMELAVVDIRSAKAMLTSLLERGTGGEVVPVANRYNKRQAVPTLADAQEALGRDVATISNDFLSALKALNHGEPVPRSAPRSPLTEDVRRLAARLLPRPVATTSRGR